MTPPTALARHEVLAEYMYQHQHIIQQLHPSLGIYNWKVNSMLTYK